MIIDDDCEHDDVDDVQDPFFLTPANLENKAVAFLLECNLGKPFI